ncbi:hydrogenase large subunit [Leifsonia shinshuensis]|uniref:NADH-quinone oxidoreductase subunit D n=1 Tax=Leifsonia shinshuensis TaxID=150026 RepID=A0A7G6YEB0_9MICO|nr:NADH-quinone oxidoreductase subunit C [Leifsonia shinshuensis]QNE36825.1 NADH-quinone oxidoreductase subunit D [Leifsonia shinshuensis]
MSDVRLAEQWRDAIRDSIEDGARFAGLFGTATAGGCRLTVLLAVDGGFELRSIDVVDEGDGLRYPALTPVVPSAFWYERAAADLSGVVPVGHPRLDPLLLPIAEGSLRPRPGQNGAHLEESAVRTATPPGPVEVEGRGLFTIAYGPVRSGVAESIEYLVETPGEDIPRLNIRPHYKHRGIAKAFEGRSIDDGVLVAERVEGIASATHASAYVHSVEALTGTIPPLRAQLSRVVVAEVERIANHLDVAMKLAEAAGLAVANTRFAWHKESTLRLMSALTGSRFGRSFVVPGGIARPLALSPDEILDAVRVLRERIRPDAALAMKTPSFLDRLRGTGRLDPAHAREWGALGPVGRGSGVIDDNRWSRPTDAYGLLVEGLEPAVEKTADVLARTRVRWSEIETAVVLVERACSALREVAGESSRAHVPAATGTAVGWSEGPHGEIVYVTELQEGRIVRCFARTPSLHNLVLLHDVFNGDVLTDFAFNEFSFGLSAAGVAM